jgi:hypothetical protein
MVRQESSPHNSTFANAGILYFFDCKVLNSSLFVLFTLAPKNPT